MTSSVHHSARPPGGEDEPKDPRSQAPADSGGDAPGPPSQGGSTSGRPSDDESELQLKKLSPAGLAASGAAAATASVVGGQLGIAGTVVGAFLTSVVSATALALYTDSVTRSKSKLKTVRGKGHAPSTVTSAHGDPSSRPDPDDKSTKGDREVRDEADRTTSGKPSRGRRIVRIAVFSVVIAVIGIVAVFGIQRVTGTELSPGTGEIQRSVSGTDAVTPRDDSASSDDESPADESPADEQQDQEGLDSEQQDGEAPGPDLLDDSGDGAGPEQQDGEAPENQDDAPADQRNAPAEQGSGSDSDDGSNGSGSDGGGSDGGGSGEQGEGGSSDE